MRIHPPIPGHSPGPFCAGTCLFAPMVLLGGTSERGSEGGVCAGLPSVNFHRVQSTRGCPRPQLQRIPLSTGRSRQSIDRSSCHKSLQGTWPATEHSYKSVKPMQCVVMVFKRKTSKILARFARNTESATSSIQYLVVCCPPPAPQASPLCPLCGA